MIQKDLVHYKGPKSDKLLEQTGNGQPPKERNKYLFAGGSRNRLYLHPETRPERLLDTTLPVVFVEGVFKAIAAWTLSWVGLGEAAEKPRFLVIGLSGVNNWWGTIGKETASDGTEIDLKGPIPDLEKIALGNRKVTILFDTNVNSNENVQRARRKLTRYLKERGSRAFWSAWPKDTPDEVNGIDDFLALRGPEAALTLIESAQAVGDQSQERFTRPEHWKRYNLANVEDWPVSPLVPIISGIVAKGNFVFVAAQSQTWKTLLWLYIARLMIQGGKLFGKYPVTPVKKLLYLVLEDPGRRIKDRLLDMDHEFAAKPEPGRFIVDVAPGFSIADHAMFGYLEDQIKQEGFEVVFIDTYQRATPGLNSFNDEKQSEILHKLANLTRQAGVTLIVLDHVRKEGNSKTRNSLSLDDIKGTGGKVQNADCAVLMERAAKNSNQLKFQSFSKDFSAFIGLLLEVAAEGSREPKFKHVGDLTEFGDWSKKKGEERRQKILEAMKPGEWISSKQLREKIGLSRNVFTGHMKTLVKERLVDEGGEKKSKCYCRLLSEGGNSANSARQNKNV